MAELGSAISIEIDEKLYIPFYDLSLNTAELISQKLEPIESYRYNAFGKEEIETQNKSVINPWRFSSKRVDDETGYVYFGRRYYDSELGRWTTKDPKGYEEGINFYAYGLNNPLNLHDLYGLMLMLEGRIINPSYEDDTMQIPNGALNDYNLSETFNEHTTFYDMPIGQYYTNFMSCNLGIATGFMEVNTGVDVKDPSFNRYFQGGQFLGREIAMGIGRVSSITGPIIMFMGVLGELVFFD